MPPDNLPPGSPQSWLRYAKADLAIAKTPFPKDGLYEIYCYHAQQAAEKSIKSLFVYYGIEIPKIHNIARLLTLLPDQLNIPTSVIESSDLSVYATLTKYPNERELVMKEQFDEALQKAETVHSWANDIICGLGGGHSV